MREYKPQGKEAVHPSSDIQKDKSSRFANYPLPESPINHLPTSRINRRDHQHHPYTSLVMPPSSVDDMDIEPTITSFINEQDDFDLEQSTFDLIDPTIYSSLVAVNPLIHPQECSTSHSKIPRQTGAL